ncbi:MAG: CHAT domain-containing protein, partial [Actinomycetota bacterium]|nr:CHAT domain-containing protein [Actinomycetota bacterium]
DGARLGHIAAHGHLRTDAPLFSAIDLADGPLMVHDLQRLVRPPGAVVLSACESAGMLAVTSDEALGLVSALLGMGTRSVLASVAAVNDRATVRVMAHVHTGAAAGGTLAEGLRSARNDEDASPVVRATAAAFTAFGA